MQQLPKFLLTAVSTVVSREFSYVILRMCFEHNKMDEFRHLQPVCYDMEFAEDEFEDFILGSSFFFLLIGGKTVVCIDHERPDTALVRSDL